MTYVADLCPTFTNTNQTCRELTFAGLDALGPRVIKLRVAFIAAVVKPRTSRSTATSLFGFLGGTALGAHGIGVYWSHRFDRGRRRTAPYNSRADVGHTRKRVAGVLYLNFINVNPTCRELTFAGLEAFGIRVFKLCCVITTFFKPRTTRSTTTPFFGFLDGAALRTFGIGVYWSHRFDRGRRRLAP